MALFFRFSPPRKYKCVFCGHKMSGFLPYRLGHMSTPQLMRALEMIGSNPDIFECPWCGCHDRERHLYLYMSAVGLLPDLSGKRVLHFAPERHLSSVIHNAKPQGYIKCDLFPQAEDVQRVNMLEIPFEEGGFDLVIANHVLEHVSDDLQGLSEIFRVLKPGGLAILQTPYSPVLHQTWSDSGIATDAARLQAFGQEDHVRLFGLDIFERFARCGLVSCVATHDELLANQDPVRLGLNKSEPFFLFRKP